MFTNCRFAAIATLIQTGGRVTWCLSPGVCHLITLLLTSDLKGRLAGKLCELCLYLVIAATIELLRSLQGNYSAWIP